MPNPRLASRYAKSLLDIAVEKNVVADTYKDVQYIAAVCNQSREFCNMLRSPVVNADKKQAVINSIFKANISTLSNAFITLLIKKGREGYLPEIVQSFEALYKELHKIKTIKLTTAVPATAALQERVKSKVLSLFPGNTVELEASVDSDIIGGFVLETDGKIYDASVAKQLKDIKTSFAQNAYVSKLN